MFMFIEDDCDLFEFILMMIF